MLSPLQIFIHYNKKTIAFPFYSQFPIWFLKAELENDYSIHWDDHRLICQGKALQDADFLTKKMNGSTLRIISRVRGGDPFDFIGDLFNGITKIFDIIMQVVNIVTSIFDKIMTIMGYIKCGFLMLQNLWYCIIFYVIYLFFWIIHQFIVIICHVFDLIIDDIMKNDSAFMVDGLYSLENFFLEIFKIFLNLFPSLQKISDIYMKCFNC